MPKAQKEPLRALTDQEEKELQRLVKASSERVDAVRRAKALLMVHQGHPFTQAAHQAGFHNGDSVCKLVKRFNQHGLAALSIATGRGRKPTYHHQERQQVLQVVHQTPDRKEDQTATWSLSLLQRSLRQKGLKQIGASTIRRVLHEAGYVFGSTRTWCHTGTAQRKRKSGIETVHDPKTEEKKV
jgi:transposase